MTLVSKSRMIAYYVNEKGEESDYLEEPECCVDLSRVHWINSDPDGGCTLLIGEALVPKWVDMKFKDILPLWQKAKTASAAHI